MKSIRKVRTINSQGSTFWLNSTLEFVFLEVPKVPKTYYNNLDMWMHFLKGISKKEAMKMDNSNIHKAFETLEYISQDPIALAKYEARQKFFLDLNTSLYTERKEGRDEAIIHVAKKMKSMCLPLQVVIDATGLSARGTRKNLKTKLGPLIF